MQQRRVHPASFPADGAGSLRCQFPMPSMAAPNWGQPILAFQFFYPKFLFHLFPQVIIKATPISGLTPQSRIINRFLMSPTNEPIGKMQAPTPKKGRTIKTPKSSHTRLRNEQDMQVLSPASSLPQVLQFCSSLASGSAIKTPACRCRKLRQPHRSPARAKEFCSMILLKVL